MRTRAGSPKLLPPAVAAALGLALLCPRVVRASNEDDFFVGSQAAMTGGAVVATVSDGGAAFYNHAGLAAAGGSRLDVSASAYGLRLYSVENFLAVSDGRSKAASVTEFIALPTQIAYLRQLDDDLTLGLGYFVPRGANALLSERLVTRDGDASSTWALDTRVTESSYWLVAALGLRVTERLRVGFGLFGVYDQSVQSTGFFGGVQAGDQSVKALELSSLGTASRISGVLGGGVQLDLTPDLTLGLWARGPQLQLVSSAEESISLVLAEPAMDGVLQLMAMSSPVDESGEQVGLVALGRYHVGLGYRAGRTTLSLEADLQPGLRSTRTQTDRALTINGRAGVLRPITDHITLGAGVFSDRGTEGSSASTTLDFYGTTVGIEIDDVLGLASGERADSLTLSSVFALRYAYGGGTTPTVIADPEAELAGVFGNGKNRQRVHEFGLHVGSALRF